MNMIIHDDGHTNVIGKDALEDFEEFQKLNKDFKEGYFDIVFSNPPFGATIKKKEVKYLDNFDLAKDAKGITKKTQKTEILFIERCIKLCKPKTGRIAIVLPAGVLTNTSLQNIRNYVLDKLSITCFIFTSRKRIQSFWCRYKIICSIFKTIWKK